MSTTEKWKSYELFLDITIYIDGDLKKVMTQKKRIISEDEHY
jgi:hypothetical protein